jgi:hypothetical protein
MIKRFAITLLFLLSLLSFRAFAQLGNMVAIAASGAPAGTCSYVMRYTDTGSGNEYNCPLGTWNQITGGGGGNTCGSPTCTVSTAGVGNGVLALSGNTSGRATFTAPAIAGTTTNAVVSSNVVNAPGYSLVNGSIPASATGMFNTAANNITFESGGSNDLTLNTSAFQIFSTAIKSNANTVWWSNTAPTISSGFGTLPLIAANNGTLTFTINVGSGGTATSGVIGLPTATTGWYCSADDETNPGANFTKQSAHATTTATLTNYNSAGTPTAWSASDILLVRCTAW